MIVHRYRRVDLTTDELADLGQTGMTSEPGECLVPHFDRRRRSLLAANYGHNEHYSMFKA
jgi:D-alanyl-D-alanine carboxypeptidase